MSSRSSWLWLSILVLGGLLATAQEARAQSNPYIGLVYPAGGRRGTTVRVRLGGQRIDGVYDVLVSGSGVKARLIEYHRRLSNQERRILRDQLKQFNRKSTRKNDETRKLAARIQRRMAGYVNRPACAWLANLAFVEVTIAPDAAPGRREIRLVAERGVSNPMPFHVGQLPEVARKPMKTSTLQVLGKEYLALRKRPADEEEVRITTPCTMNGQVASGEVNRYRFKARKGQRLVIATAARQLIPYIADAVPGWFQPVLTLYDANGREVAFNDDYRFMPDPTLFYEVAKDGEYVLTIADAIYRGREDFVYRITIGELPFVTSIFPLGGRMGRPVSIEISGWNLQKATLAPPAKNARPGIYRIPARSKGFISNRVAFALDTLPECFDKESNNDLSHAQKVTLPVIVNGRSDRPNDWDVFRFEGRAGQTVVAEVHARRLDSPMDSLLKLTDAKGKVLAFNDDHEDPAVGLNTHHADSYLRIKLPADGPYYLHLGDTARKGGQEYAYRLRISPPRPDFALRVVPSSVLVRAKSSGAVTVYAIRKDGFAGPIKLKLNDAPTGFTSSNLTLSPTQEKVRLTVRTTLRSTKQPLDLRVTGHAKILGRDVDHDAVPAEDRMQAFLWRHLVPAEQFKALVYNRSKDPATMRVPPPRPTKPTSPAVAAKRPAATAKFTKRQVAGRLRLLKRLYEQWLLTDSFYNKLVTECEASL